jgi:putative acetyltransferase
LGRRYVDDHPLTLLLDIDALRLSLGGWQDHEETRVLARGLAVAMAEAHLRAGHDVVVPQYVGRLAFIKTLDQLAQRLGARFVEVLVTDDEAVVAERFGRRRAELHDAGRSHPQADVGPAEVRAASAEAFERLRGVAAVRVGTHIISTAVGFEHAYAALREVVEKPDAGPPPRAERNAMKPLIAVEDPQAEDVRELLHAHLTFSHEVTPAGHVHALDVGGLLDPAVTFLAARRDGLLLGVGALKELDDAHGELKSMHTAASARRQGIGQAMVDHLLSLAAERHYRRVSLETGTMEAYAAARTLYANAGFRPCEPFGQYTSNPHSTCMTMLLGSSPGGNDDRR